MILSILFILLTILGLGLPLVLLLVPKHNIWGKLGLSYILGVGIFTLLIYISNLLGLKIIALNIVLLFLALSVPLVISQYKKLNGFRKEILDLARRRKLDFVDKLLLGGIAFFIISGFINTLYWPVFKWDSLTLYDFRAHVFIKTGFIIEALTSLGDRFYFAYPLLTSLLHTIVYIFGGSNPKFIYSLFYLSLGLVFYGQLREFVPKKLSLLFTFMLLSIPQIFGQSLVSYTNLAYLTYFSLGTIYYFFWDKKKDVGYLVISAILIGLSTWVRSADPFWLAILGVVVLTSIYRRRIIDFIVFIFSLIPIQQAWMTFSSALSTKNTTVGEITKYTPSIENIFNLNQWLIVLKFIYENILITWGSVFVLFIAFLFYAIIIRKRKYKPLIYIISISLLAMILFGTFTLSLNYSGWSAIPDSASRTAMVVYPLFIYSAAIVSFNKIDDNKK